MLISEALILAKDILKHKGINSYQIDTLLIMRHCTSLTKEQIIFSSELTLNPEKTEEFFALIKRRENKEPISQIIGRREFFGKDFIVTKDVLDPRPDSETLIESILKHYQNHNLELNILELGTGSGCLLLTILDYFKNSYGTGIDISELALAIAKKNAASLNLSKRSNFLQSNWFSNLNKVNKFDLIISNPPYIKTDEIQFLQTEVKKFEPFIALDGGENGLNCYENIASQIINFLKDDGIIVVEIGQNQELDVIEIFNKNGFKLIKENKDLSQIVRCLIFIKQNINENIF